MNIFSEEGKGDKKKSLILRRIHVKDSQSCDFRLAEHRHDLKARQINIVASAKRRERREAEQERGGEVQRNEETEKRRRAEQIEKVTRENKRKERRFCLPLERLILAARICMR